MKNKNGFTLVELLAVVAILALLVIISLPNIMELFNEAKENSFLTECKQIYKTAQQQWMSDSMFSTEERTYSRCHDCTGKQLKLSGREEISYYVSLNKAGKVTTLQVTDGTFQYVYSGEELKIEDIVEAERIAGLQNNEVITIKPAVSGEIYIAYDGELRIGQPIPANVTYYTSYSDFLEASSRAIFLKHKVVNNVVKESYVGFRFEGNVYYMQGGNTNISQQSRITNLRNIYNDSGCHDEISYPDHEVYGFRCIRNKIDIGIYNNSGVVGYDTSSGCYVGCRINSDGSSRCDSLDIFC